MTQMITDKYEFFFYPFWSFGEWSFISAMTALCFLFGPHSSVLIRAGGSQKAQKNRENFLLNWSAVNRYIDLFRIYRAVNFFKIINRFVQVHYLHFFCVFLCFL